MGPVRPSSIDLNVADARSQPIAQAPTGLPSCPSLSSVSFVLIVSATAIDGPHTCSSARGSRLHPKCLYGRVITRDVVVVFGPSNVVAATVANTVKVPGVR